MESDLLRERLDHLRSALLTASEGRYPPPRIIAVTKTHPAEMILPLAGLGIQEIGENRVQEIREKVPLLDGKFAVHLIGRLQTNKVKYIMKDVVMIQSLDRMELAHEINRQALKHRMVMPVLVQVSPAGEEQKGGIDPAPRRPWVCPSTSAASCVLPDTGAPAAPRGAPPATPRRATTQCSRGWASSP